MTFRFDDVSANTNLPKLFETIDAISRRLPHAEFLLAISPIYFRPRQFLDAYVKGSIGLAERVHPPRLTAMSTLSPYYEGEGCGVPDILERENLKRAGHGLAHVDHRLLSRDAQEMSILMSCSLARATTFVPPYNKWNDTTEDICVEFGIELVKFEDGWRHVIHSTFDPNHDLFYVHPYETDPERIVAWIGEV